MKKTIRPAIFKWRQTEPELILCAVRGYLRYWHVKAKQGFREFHAARRTIPGYEAIHMIRKGQARWVSGSDVQRQIQFINKLFGVAA